MQVGFRKLAGASRAGELPRTQRFRAAVRQRRQHLDGAVAESATRLLPLVALLDALQPQLTQESVFRTRRKKLRAHWDAAYAELQVAHPRHRALATPSKPWPTCYATKPATSAPRSGSKPPKS